MKISFVEISKTSPSSLLIASPKESLDSSLGEPFLEKNKNFYKDLFQAYDFIGKADTNVSTTFAGQEGLQSIVFQGLGKKEDICDQCIIDKGGDAYSLLSKFKNEFVSVYLADLTPRQQAQWLLGLHLKSWTFEKYKTTKKDDSKKKIKEIALISKNSSQVQELFDSFAPLAEGIFLTRELVSEPGNVINPPTLAKNAKTLEKDGIVVEIMGEATLKEKGFHAIVGVGQGSEFESQLVTLQWKGAKDPKAPWYVLVGKGVTFDTGGISIKPRTAMDEMKHDMAGAATVMGVIKAIAKAKVPINVAGITPLVENMPSGSAQRPGDVVKSLSGQTIEILDTDAEGRLILADALWYAQDRFKPKYMVDLATLTGAISIALGHEYAGLFGSSDTLCDQLLSSSNETGERLWRLPLNDAFDKEINSDIADVKNLASPSCGGGSITAAQFLKRFTNEVSWAHLDIAGTAWSKKDKSLCHKGATAFGVRLLYNWLLKMAKEQ